MNRHIALQKIIETGIGISILPKLVLRKTNYNVTILPISPVIKRKIGLVMKEKHIMPAASKVFIRSILENIDKLL